MDMKDPRAAVRNMLQRQDMSIFSLWLRYWANGGTLFWVEFEAFVFGLLEPDPFEVKILAWALEDAPGY